MEIFAKEKEKKRKKLAKRGRVENGLGKSRDKYAFQVSLG